MQKTENRPSRRQATSRMGVICRKGDTAAIHRLIEFYDENS